MSDDVVFVAVPVYRGADVLPEALRSIREQTYEHLRVVISIDGDDPASLAVCERAAAQDPRFEVIAQPERLGWPGNFNWLAERCDEDLFLYWQQDDFASSGYVAALVETLSADPEAAAAATDVQWFGDRVDREVAPSIAGAPLERILEALELMAHIPLRGLIRTSLLPPAPAIRPWGDRSKELEFAFIARLAARGSFARAEGELYFKRAHGASTTHSFTALPGERRLRGWASTGAAILHEALGHAEERDHGRLLALVLDRLAIYRPGRQFYAFDGVHSPATVREMALLLADEAGIDLGDERWALHPGTGLERPIHPLVRQALEDERGRAAQLRGEDPPLDARLGWGWHSAEDWGAWARGASATIELGRWPGGPLSLVGEAFAPDGPIRVGVSLSGDEPSYTQVEHGPVSLTVDAPPGTPRVHLHLPDAVAPAEAGVSVDQRRLGFGLVRVRRDPAGQAAPRSSPASRSI